jgi:hypothetical protein
MPVATFRFYEELNENLPVHKRKIDFEQEFQKGSSLKDIIELFDVPCGDIDLILVNGRTVDFEYVIDEGDRVSVYPVFERFDIQEITSLIGRPLRRLKFIVDSNLEKLAVQMNELNLDTYFNPKLTKERVLEMSRIERRILITMSPNFFDSKNIDRIIIVDSAPVSEQVTQITDSLFLTDKADGSR